MRLDCCGWLTSTDDCMGGKNGDGYGHIILGIWALKLAVEFFWYWRLGWKFKKFDKLRYSLT